MTNSARQRAEALLANLTIEEKIAQLNCVFPRDPHAVEGILDDFPASVGHVSSLEMRQATDLDDVAAFQRHLQQKIIASSRHGIPAVFHMEALCGAYLPEATSFPSGIGRGSTFDPSLEQEIGEIVGRQERALGITYSFAPVLDISRDPRMGRQGEAYGEDPTLTSSMGVAFARGLQQVDETGRTTECVAKHFLGFHAGEGGVHGTHADIPYRQLREIYGKPFQAVITEAGLRGIMPCYNAVGGETASSSHRLLSELLRDQMGFEGVVGSDYGAIGNLHLFQKTAESFADAGEAAMSAGMDAEWHVVMGFNEDLTERFRNGQADLMILDRAVLRVLEAKFRMGLFENPYAYEGEPLHAPFDAEKNREITLRAARESLVLLRNDRALPLGPSLRKIAVIGPHADNARSLFGGYTHLSMVEGLLAANSSMAGLATANEHLAEFEDIIPGTQVQNDRAARFDEVLQTLKPGTRNLVEELRERLPGTEVAWALGHQIAGGDTSCYDQAVEVAGDADLILVTLGGKYGTSSIATTGEGIDAVDVTLPSTQEGMIRRLAELQVPIVGVHFDGRPLSSDVADAHCSALLEAWTPAEAGAQAIVDVLLGEVEPTGRMPVSSARHTGQIPIYYNHPNGSQWHQGDSIGFPEYVDAPHTPRYPFGHGLGYTTFDYTELTVNATEASPMDTVEVTVTVQNVGERDGTEVVQLYASDRYATVSRPVQELVGFERVEAAAGETRRVSFAVPLTMLAFLDRNLQWTVESGDIDLRVGSSSEDIRLERTLSITDTARINERTRGFWAEVRSVS